MHFLLVLLHVLNAVVSVWLKVSDVGECGEREGGKEGRQGGIVLRARLSRSCPARLREEGDVTLL